MYGKQLLVLGVTALFLTGCGGSYKTTADLDAIQQQARVKATEEANTALKEQKAQVDARKASLDAVEKNQKATQEAQEKARKVYNEEQEKLVAAKAEQKKIAEHNAMIAGKMNGMKVVTSFIPGLKKTVIFRFDPAVTLSPEEANRRAHQTTGQALVDAGFSYKDGKIDIPSNRMDEAARLATQIVESLGGTLVSN